MIIKVIKNNV